MWDSTKSPYLFKIFLTVHSAEALMTCSIFMAYIAKIASPFFNFAPYLTNTFDIVPGIGVMAFSAAPSSFLGYFLWSVSNLNPVESPLASKILTQLSSIKYWTFLTWPLITQLSSLGLTSL